MIALAVILTALVTALLCAAFAVWIVSTLRLAGGYRCDACGTRAECAVTIERSPRGVRFGLPPMPDGWVAVGAHHVCRACITRGAP